jgi:hypothetical protein
LEAAQVGSAVVRVVHRDMKAGAVHQRPNLPEMSSIYVPD